MSMKVFVGKGTKGGRIAIPFDNVAYVAVGGNAGVGKAVVGFRESADHGGVELIAEDGERLISMMQDN